MFAILSVFLDASKDSQTDLVKFYVKNVRSPNIFDNYGIILHKKKKKESLPSLLFFITR